MTIRPASASDVPLILGFIRGLAEFEKLSHEVEASEEKLTATLFPREGRAAAECILAFEGQDAVGFALYFTTYSTFLARPGLYLEDIFVTPAHRGKGFGKAMMLFLARLANQRGYGRMEWAVLDWNASAIKFYESLGARRLEDWTICRLAGEALRRHA